MHQVKTKHPGFETLVSFTRGMLEESVLTEVADHLGQCDSCRSDLAAIPKDRLGQLVSNVSRSAQQSNALYTRSSADNISNDDGEKQIPPALRALKRYRVLEHIGSGGMGDVFRAEHKLMQRMVALKVINPNLTQHDEAIARFRNEVRAAASLSHPNIVSSYDADNIGQLQFLVMELVDGVSLSQHVEDNGLPTVEEAIDMIEQACRGLNAAFNKAMVHRDIKPQNLMLTREGTVKIMDFGLARFQRQQIQDQTDFEPIQEESPIETSARLTGTHRAIGTPDYLAPEQARAATQADTRSDIYSLGGTFYFLLTGYPMYHQGNAVEKISQHFSGQPKALTTLRDDLPMPVVELVNRMIEKDPDARFQTPGELLAGIKDVKVAIGVLPPQTNTSRRWLIGAAALALFAGLVSAFSGAWASQAKKILLIAPTRAYYPDYEAVKRELNRRGATLVVASPESEIAPVSDEFLEPFAADVLLSQVQIHRYDAVVFIGGQVAELTEGGAAKQTNRIIREAREGKTPLGAICVGIDVLKRCDLKSVRDLVKDSTNQRIATFDGVVTAVDTEDVEAFLGRLLR